MPRKVRELPLDTVAMTVLNQIVTTYLGQPHVALVTGPPGVGKSRMASAICGQPWQFDIRASLAYVDYQGFEDHARALKHLAQAVDGDRYQARNLSCASETVSYLARRLIQRKKKLLIVDGVEFLDPGTIIAILQVAAKMKAESSPMAVLLVGRIMRKEHTTALAEANFFVRHHDLPKLDSAECVGIACALSPAFNLLKEKYEAADADARLVFGQLYEASEGIFRTLQDIVGFYDISYPGQAPTPKLLKQVTG